MSREANVSVTVRSNEPIEKALRRFKRMCERAGISKTVRGKRFYEKPSDERRRELRKQERNRRRAERKAQERQDRKMRRARQRTNTLAAGAAELIHDHDSQES